MEEVKYNRINDYGSVTIALASPEDIRSWSYGEVKKPETINYRTYRPERDGLFCERIFGPEKDWECFCGKYKGIKHKGIVCDKCGVMITHSRVRRSRMGHVNLAAPVSHIWFFKAMPSRLGNLLGVKVSSLERVIYFQDYMVVDPGDTPLEKYQLLTEEEFRDSRAKYGAEFDADMGAEAVKKILRTLDLGMVSEELREELKATRSKQRMKDITKRLGTVEMLREAGAKLSKYCSTAASVVSHGTPQSCPRQIVSSGAITRPHPEGPRPQGGRGHRRYIGGQGCPSR